MEWNPSPGNLTPEETVRSSNSGSYYAEVDPYNNSNKMATKYTQQQQQKERKKKKKKWNKKKKKKKKKKKERKMFTTCSDGTFTTPCTDLARVWLPANEVDDLEGGRNTLVIAVHSCGQKENQAFIGKRGYAVNGHSSEREGMLSTGIHQKESVHCQQTFIRKRGYATLSFIRRRGYAANKHSLEREGKLSIGMHQKERGCCQ